MSPMRFATLRLIVLTLLVASQVYLFLRIRRGILSLGVSRLSGILAAVLTGAAIVALFFMNGYTLGRAKPWIDAPLAVRVFLFYLPAVWGFGSILSAAVLCAIGLSSAAGGAALRLVRIKAEPKAAPRVDLGRRRLLQAAVAGAATAPFALSGYGALFANKDCDVRELSLPFGRGLRVVQLSDIHAGVYMTEREIGRYVDRIIALKPDLFVVTGDFISNSMAYLPGCAEQIARVPTKYGTFATLGNHDNWYGRMRAMRSVFHRYDVSLLVNAHRILETEQGPFAVAGIDDLHTGHPDLTAALHGLDSAVPTVLLSHRPEIFPLAASRSIPLTLAGHYHGGQIKVSLAGVAISPAHLVTPYPEGLYRINASLMYVSRGIGTTFTPIRLNVPPEITVINLT